MITQTSYPVFEDGQVLTKNHLNDLAEYLEQQDRLTRAKLIGIGVVCGLEVAWEPAGNQIRISKGCAITSEGYLIAEPEVVLTQSRSYPPPPPASGGTGDTPASVAAGYSFFTDDATGNLRQMRELLPADHTPAAGEPAPTPLSVGAVTNKAVLLFLERKQENLKNCDINDCSDKGQEVEFTLRRLLVSTEDAAKILQQEQAGRSRPVDRHNHPRHELAPLRIAKLGLAAHKVRTWPDLHERIQSIVRDLFPQLTGALTDAYDAYEYMLAGLYPPAAFQNGPFGNAGYFANVERHFFQNIFLAQYVYDFFRDLVSSHNEFLRAAAVLDAECCPDPDRFPRHVLLGAAVERPVAKAVQLSGAAVAAFNPLSMDSNLGPQARPARLRHHFVPSPLFDRGGERLEEIRALHYRTYLLAYRFATDGLFQADLRITPSKDGGHDLSDKALPFYYRFGEADDLHRSWSYRKTTRGRLDQVYSYNLPGRNEARLAFRHDDHDFLQVEGIVGKPLGAALKQLLNKKRAFGLSFAIEPVFLGLEVRGDLSTAALDQQALKTAQAGLKRIMACRMRDLDAIFLIFMALVFYYLFIVIALLSRLDPRKIGTPPAPPPPPPPGGGGITIPGIRDLIIRGRGLNLNLVMKDIQADRSETDLLLKTIRPQDYEKGTITMRVTTGDDPKASVGKMYEMVKETSPSFNLFDKVRDFAGQLDLGVTPDIVADRLYPTVSLLDKAEELVNLVSAPSIVDFDFERFERRYDGFVTAFERYLDRAEEPQDEATAKTLDALRTSFGSIAAAGPQSIIRNLGSELRRRMEKVLGELVMGPYAQRHPGLEHRAGVPEGGTLVLAYTHKSFLGQSLEDHKGDIEKLMSEMRFRRKVLPNELVEIRSPKNVMREVIVTGEPLDEFVVLADFCLPYLCCETDCSDIEFAPPQIVSAVEGGRVSGNVFARRIREGALTQPNPLRNAEMIVTNMETDTAVDVTLDADTGEFAFSADPGVYRMVTRGRNLAENVRVVTIGPGGRMLENIVLTPDQ